MKNEWNSGFTAEMEISNNGGTTVQNWEVCWEYTDGARRTSGWNASVTGSNPYCASGVGWNNSIQPNQTIGFGIQGSKPGSGSPAVVITRCDAD